MSIDLTIQLATILGRVSARKYLLKAIPEPPVPSESIGIFRGVYDSCQHIGTVLFTDATKTAVLVQEGSGDNQDSFDPAKDRAFFDTAQQAIEREGYIVFRMNKPPYLCPHTNPPHPCER